MYNSQKSLPLQSSSNNRNKLVHTARFWQCSACLKLSSPTTASTLNHSTACPNSSKSIKSPITWTRLKTRPTSTNWTKPTNNPHPNNLHNKMHKAKNNPHNKINLQIMSMRFSNKISLCLLQWTLKPESKC